MSKNYDNWERLVKAILLREELRQISREDSLSSTSSFSSSSSRSFLLQSDKSSSNLGMSFSYQQILVATNHFSDQISLIKMGHSGDFYIALFRQISEPALVKRVNSKGVDRKKALSSELSFLSVINNSHRRFVPLLGHCLDDHEKEKFLVYKYLPKTYLLNSLFVSIPKNGDSHRAPLLDWFMKLKVAREVAQGLAYLHHECNPPLVHGDVQASSILLGRDYEVRLGSLSHVSAERIQTDKFKFTWIPKKATSVMAKGTRAYDIYCFGKVLLELVTSKKMGQFGSSKDDANIKEWLESTLRYVGNVYDKKRIMSIIDPLYIYYEEILEEVWAVAVIARSCLNPDPTRRPEMKYVLTALGNPKKTVKEENTATAFERL